MPIVTTPRTRFICRRQRSRSSLSRLRLSRSNLFPAKIEKPPYWVVFYLAEKERFELSRPVKAYTISNRARSTSYATSPYRLLTRLF